MSVLGLDIGTSGCKAVVFSEDGVALSSAARSYALRSPQAGWAELDAEEVWRLCAECIREAAAMAAAPVRAIAICSQLFCKFYITTFFFRVKAEVFKNKYFTCFQIISHFFCGFTYTIGSHLHFDAAK